MRADATVNAARERWNRLLETHPDAVEYLIDAQQKHGLIEGDAILCRVARPFFITQEKFNRQRMVVRELLAALRQARDYVIANRGRMDQLGAFAAWVDELMRLEVADVDHGEIARLDGFMGPDGLYFIEANCDLPGGTGHADGLAGVFEGLPFWPEFQAGFSASMVKLQPRMLSTLVESWRCRGGFGMPSIAFVGWRGQHPVSDAIMATNSAYVLDQGCRAVVVAPTELEWNGSRLLADDGPVDIVFRVMLISDVISRVQELKPLIQALRADAVCMVNSFRAELLGHKALFALLTDPEVNLGLSAVQRAIVDAHVPWGRLLREHVTTAPEGEPVDLLPWVIANRERLVLKPTHSAAGRGVVLGWHTEPAVWQRKVEAIADADHVVQLRTALMHGCFPLLEDDLTEAHFVQDIDPFVFNGNLGGFLSRLSSGDVTNVSAGGSLVPTVILKGNVA